MTAITTRILLAFGTRLTINVGLLVAELPLATVVLATFYYDLNRKSLEPAEAKN